MLPARKASHVVWFVSARMLWYPCQRRKREAIRGAFLLSVMGMVSGSAHQEARREPGEAHEEEIDWEHDTVVVPPGRPGPVEWVVATKGRLRHDQGQDDFQRLE